MLAIYDEDLKEIGKAPREEAHRKGLLHQVVHCWVAARQEEEIWLYFQQRSFEKKDFPGLYDLAVGGHIDAGEEATEALLREMREEIGVVPQKDRLRYLGIRREEIRLGTFYDREIAQVYLYDPLQPSFSPGEEVERMIGIPLPELKKKELFGQKEILGYTLDGKRITLKEEMWCRHPGEFEEMVLPVIQGLEVREL